MCAPVDPAGGQLAVSLLKFHNIVVSRFLFCASSGRSFPTGGGVVWPHRQSIERTGACFLAGLTKIHLTSTGISLTVNV